MPAESKETMSKDRAPAPQPDQDEPTFTVERLRRDGHLTLGRPIHVVAGALAGLGEGDQLTVDQARARVEAFLSAPVEMAETPQG